MAKANQPKTPTGKVYVYSTLVNSTKYVDYEEGGADLKHEARSVIIQGGTGIANKHFLTPRGIVTEVSAEDYAWLKDNFHFKFHLEKGHITVDTKKHDPEKAASDMNLGDPSSPLTPSDYPGAGENDIKEPSVGKTA